MTIIRRPFFNTGVIGKGTKLPVDGGPGVGDETVVIPPPPSGLIVIDAPFFRIAENCYDATSLLQLDTSDLFDPNETQNTGSHQYYQNTYYNGNLLLKTPTLGTLSIYKTADGSTPLLKTGELTGTNIKCMGITPDNKYALITTNDGAYFLDALTFETIVNDNLDPDQTSTQRVGSVNHDSTRYTCALASGNPAALWDTSNPESWVEIPTSKLPGNAQEQWASFHPNQDILITKGSGFKIFTHDLNNPLVAPVEVINIPSPPHSLTAIDIKPTKDGKFLICKNVTPDDTNAFYVISISDPDPTNWTVDFFPLDVDPSVTTHDSFSITPNGERMYLTSGEIYDITSLPFTKLSSQLQIPLSNVFPALVGIIGDEVLP